MNCDSLWRGDIINAEPLYSAEKNTYDNVKYKLYATGDCNVQGRKYVALPENMQITEEIKKQYNLMM